MNDDDAAVVVVVDVDLASAPGTSVSALPRYVVTEDALVHSSAAAGSRPALSARALLAGEVDRLREAAVRLVTSADPGVGRGVEVSVVDHDGIVRVARRPVGNLGPMGEFVADVRSRTQRGDVLQVLPAGVVGMVSGTSDEGGARPWPAPDRPVVAGECIEVRGHQGAAVLDAVEAGAWDADGFATVVFSQDGATFSVSLRPLVLGERPCPQPAP